MERAQHADLHGCNMAFSSTADELCRLVFSRRFSIQTPTDCPLTALFVAKRHSNIHRRNRVSLCIRSTAAAGPHYK